MLKAGFGLRRCLVVACCLAGGAGAVSAQDPVERIRALYASAAYEDALAAMPEAGPTERITPDIERYRALCLLALGREDQAVASVERLLRDDPTFVPSASETSPRMRSLFTAARARVVPELAKEAYAAAKKAFDARAWPEANRSFGRARELMAALPGEERAELADLETLAAEFEDLTAALSARPAPVPTQTEPSDPGPEPPAATGPVTIRQDMPAWVPPDGTNGAAEYAGVLRVQINDEGQVEQATIIRASHPSYDVVLVNAARRWLYRPATRAGRPVASQKEIAVLLRAR